VSALSIVVGWEAMVVLRDVRMRRRIARNSPDRGEQVLRWAASSLVRAMLEEATRRRLR